MHTAAALSGKQIIWQGEMENKEWIMDKIGWFCIAIYDANDIIMPVTTILGGM
jgi:hypothetical protein